uniref:Uncharacterized protein n=1 Tax=Chromera velia CCMP2878 TaxID=1169474 RepID=A0A0G4G5E5_9ALVE|eukprot:Cvel_20370.t1-p1 / transcript=Cvel_20370.t1 / gene=Cvel_20370 / organism=Chromera_velia_CCMP2878 / gene_product=hypothetical protein / transcript_product=hypothetical protein / location=Cvel_scaffold1822:25821-30423(+) / protein_length=638 / sequence_SO=supercontig / SO=protein_coding / is_pseudo=false
MMPEHLPADENVQRLALGSVKETGDTETADACTVEGSRPTVRLLRSVAGFLAGFLCVVAAALFMSLVHLSVQSASRYFVLSEIVIVRAGVQVLLCVVSFYARKVPCWGWRQLKPSAPLWGGRTNLKWVSFRAVASCVCTILMCFSLTQLPVGDVSAIMQSSSVITALIGRLWLKETGHWIVWFSGVGALVGVVFILQPPLIFDGLPVGKTLGGPAGSESHEASESVSVPARDAAALPRGASVALCVGAAVCQALVNISTRKLLDVSFQTNVLPGSALSVIGAMVLLGAIQQPEGEWVGRLGTVPWVNGWLPLLSSGVSGFASLSLMSIGMQMEKAGPASFMMTFDVVFSFVFQTTLLRLGVSPLSCVGASLVVVSALGVVGEKVYGSKGAALSRGCCRGRAAVHGEGGDAAGRSKTRSATSVNIEHEKTDTSPAGASTNIGPGHCASKVVELPAKLVFSSKREELQRWLKDVEDFFELNEVRESKKMKMAKGRLPAYLKEWYEKYEEEHGVFSNWESLKTELTERLKVTMERSIARAKLQALHCTEALGMEKYNEAFSQLVGQLPHLWEEDVVEDYIKGLPNSIALDVTKAKTHTLLEIQKEAAEIEAFLFSRAKDSGHRDFRLHVPESGGVSGQVKT